jgi:hypothetical protein
MLEKYVVSGYGAVAGSSEHIIKLWDQYRQVTDALTGSVSVE